MDWDSTSYTDSPHCIRRFDPNLTWPTATGCTSTGRSGARRSGRSGWATSSSASAQAWDTTLIDSQFDYAVDTSFSAAAKATYETALARDGKHAANLVKERFAARGITF